MTDTTQTTDMSALDFTTIDSREFRAHVRRLRGTSRMEDFTPALQLGYTRLHLAVLADDTAAAEEMLAAGVNANVPTGMGDVPLPILFCHSAEMLRVLLRHGALINVTRDTESGETPLRNAVEQMDTEMVRLLLAAGAEPNFPSGKTQPLHVADDLSLVRLLVEAGADVNAENHIGFRPLELARQTDIREYLRAHGATEGA